MSKINLERLRSTKRYRFYYANTDEIVTPEFVKELRKKFNMTQLVFSTVLGVTKKTIEKWEQGKNPIKGANAKLLYLLDKKPELINDLYFVEVLNGEKCAQEKYSHILERRFHH